MVTRHADRLNPAVLRPLLTGFLCKWGSPGQHATSNSCAVSQSVSQSGAAVSTVLQTLPADRHVNTELSGSLAIDFKQLSFFFFVVFVFLCFFANGCKVVRQSRFHLEPAEVELTSVSDRMGTSTTCPASIEAGTLWVSIDPRYASVTLLLSPH